MPLKDFNLFTNSAYQIIIPFIQSTGFSEYQEIIGKVGRRIIQEQFFGPPIPIEVPEEHIQDPDSARSICGQILANTSKNIVMSQVF